MYIFHYLLILILKERSHQIIIPVQKGKNKIRFLLWIWDIWLNPFLIVQLVYILKHFPNTLIFWSNVIFIAVTMLPILAFDFCNLFFCLICTCKILHQIEKASLFTQRDLQYSRYIVTGCRCSIVPRCWLNTIGIITT